MGTYAGSSTWFDACVVTLGGRDNIASEHVQSNVTAIFAFKTHRVVWDLCSADASLRQWMLKIRSGDAIQLVPRAQWQAWTNFVASASMRIHYTIAEVEVEIPPSPVLSLTSSDSFGKIQENYRFHRKLQNDGRTLRVLLLHPGAREDDIKCDLITSSLENATQFEALSYCWGCATDTRSIKLVHIRSNDSTNSFKTTDLQDFEITTGLDSALRHLRNTSGNVRLLWVDAICINQSNIEERGFQVDMMAAIYAHATFVRVWLGGSDESSARGMALVESLTGLDAAQAPHGLDFGWRTVYPHARQFHGDAFPLQLADLSRLFSYPWFYRVWVVQEVWKARKAVVSCGSASVPWQLIVQANRWMMDVHSGTAAMLPPIWRRLTAQEQSIPTNRQDDIDLEMGRNPRLGLLDLVLEGTGLNATDPRDKIFALLGMSKEIMSGLDTPSAVRPDYSKNTTQVFTEFARWWIGKYQSLDILSAVHATKSRTWRNLECDVKVPGQALSGPPPDHPSWVLWHEGNGEWARKTLAISGFYHASGSMTPKLDPDHTSGPRLGLEGVIFDTVRSMHYYPYFAMDDEDMTKAYEWLFDPLSIDTPPERREEVDRGLREHYVSHWGRYPPQRQEELIWTDNEETQEWENSGFPCHGKCFFKGQGGEVGLCPPGTREGDVVVVLKGGKVPVLVRRMRNEAGWQLVGECYLKGVMQGEVVIEIEKGEKAWERFVLV